MSNRDLQCPQTAYGTATAPAISRIRRSFSDPACALANLRIADKMYGIVGLLVIVMTLLMVMSIQTVRLQSQYRRALVDRSRRSKAIC